MNHSEIVSFIWSVADLIRDTFKRGKYQDVILPLTVLRRLDGVLAPSKAKVLETQRKFADKRLENLDPQLRKAAGFAFYNTGIATYIWVLTNRKAPKRKGKVQLIDATSFWVPMRKSLGDKRREIPAENAGEIVRLLQSFEEGEFAKIFPTTRFGFRKITVERPLRLNFQARPERIARIEKERAFLNLAQSKKKGEAAAKEQAGGRAFQDAIRNLLRSLPDTLFKSKKDFEVILEKAARKSGLKLPAPIIKAILSALSERDETAAICHDRDGNPEPDPELRDTESVPLADGDDPVDAQGVPNSVRTFFEREVKPYVPDAWIDTARRDEKDGRVGVVGYEINFNRYFYKYVPPRPLEEIEADIRVIEKDIMRMLAEITGQKDE